MGNLADGAGGNLTDALFRHAHDFTDLLVRQVEVYLEYEYQPGIVRQAMVLGCQTPVAACFYPFLFVPVLPVIINGGKFAKFSQLIHCGYSFVPGISQYGAFA